MKKLLITFLFVGGILLLYWGIGGFPIVLDNSTQVIPLAKVNSGTFNPLEGMSLDTGENKVILLLSFDDIIELPSNVCKRKVLVCSDNSILKQLQNNFDFKISGGDMATAQSQIIVVKNNEIILKANLVIDENFIGIQNEKLGWAEATNKEKLSNLFKKFKPYRRLLLVLSNNRLGV